MPVLLHKPVQPASPELKTGHVYRLLEPTRKGREYFVYLGSRDAVAAKIIYLNSSHYEGGWNPATVLGINDVPYVEVTLQEVL